MKPKELRWMFVAVLAVLLIVGFLSDPISIGVSEQWASGSYRFAGGTHPGALAFSALIAFLYILLLFSEPVDPGKPLPGVLRRFVAFYLDMILAIMAMAPVFGLLPTLLEWRRTGVFEWNFERTTPAPGDGFMAESEIGLMFVALAFYFAIPLMRKRPSPGSC